MSILWMREEYIKKVAAFGRDLCQNCVKTELTLFFQYSVPSVLSSFSESFVKKIAREKRIVKNKKNPHNSVERRTTPANKVRSPDPAKRASPNSALAIQPKTRKATIDM